ncbi:PA-domain containing subtilase family protein [Wolffia australiana]
MRKFVRRCGISEETPTSVFSDSAEFLLARQVVLHDELLLSTLDEGTYRRLYSFKHIINGFAVHSTTSQAAKLAKSPWVKRVERDKQTQLMTTHTPSFLGVPAVWAQQGGEKTAGEGVLIGIIDTGINPNHPSFANDLENPYKQGWRPHFKGHCEVSSFGRSFCNGKIVSARHFSAGAEVVFHLNSSKNLSPLDEVGHGTHVAAVAAGNWGVPVVVGGFDYGIASGMAPRARIAVYKAIYPEGGTISDVICAVDQAALDRVDVLVLSIGPGKAAEDAADFLSAFEVSLLFVRRAGIFVVQAGGNNGPNEATTIAISPWAFAAAAGTTDRKFGATLELDDGSVIPGIGLTGPSSESDALSFKTLVAAKDAGNCIDCADECQREDALDQTFVQGAVVICNFSHGFANGSSTLAVATNTAKKLGFGGLILAANPELGDFIAEPLPFSVPGVMIPKASDSKIMLDYYAMKSHRDGEGKVAVWGGRAKIGEGRVASFGEGAPVVTWFSSRGPTLADNLKPDILAPGNQIWAAWSPISIHEPMLRGEDFALLSGTSMAAPHVAGIAALVKQIHSTWEASEIASALSTTATKYDRRGIPIFSQEDPQRLRHSTPFERGAGLVNPSRAVNPGLVFPSGFGDYVRFLCSIPELDLEMVNRTIGEDCSGLKSKFSTMADLNLPAITISSLKGILRLRRRMKNVGRAEEIYLISVLEPEGVRVHIKPSVFTIQPQKTQDVKIKLKAIKALKGYSFGEIVLTGSLDHIVRLPLSIFPVSEI